MPRPAKDDALHMRQRIVEEDEKILKAIRKRLVLAHAYATFGGDVTDIAHPAWAGLPTVPPSEVLKTTMSHLMEVRKMGTIDAGDSHPAANGESGGDGAPTPDVGTEDHSTTRRSVARQSARRRANA